MTSSGIRSPVSGLSLNRVILQDRQANATCALASMSYFSLEPGQEDYPT